jgi:hypothetical protein
MNRDGSQEVINPLYLSIILSSQNRIIENQVEVIIEENDRCIICLGDIEENNKIKPCVICETFMDKECLAEYILHNKNHIKCPTCKGELINVGENDTRIRIGALTCISLSCGICVLVSSVIIIIYPLFII